VNIQGLGFNDLDDIGKSFRLIRLAIGMRWRRAPWLVPALAVLMLAAAAEFSGTALRNGSLRILIAALKDPLTLLSDRSPGKRSGRLIPIKGKGGPRERVLSQVRDRPAPGLDVPPVVLDMPLVLDIPAGELVPPGEVPVDQIGLPPPAAPFNLANFVPGNIAIPPFGFIPGETPALPGTPITPPGTPPPGGSTPGSPTSPGGPTPGGPTSPGETPGGPGGPTSPPGGSTTPEGPPPSIELPEPAPWTMMMLGVFAVGVSRRNQVSKTARKLGAR